MTVFNSVVVICLAVASILPNLCNGFLPNFLFSVATFSPNSIDHQEITEAAALTILRDFLLDNPNTNIDSTSAINNLQNPSARDLFGAYYHGTTTCTQVQCDLAHRHYTQALGRITAANTDADGSESGIPSAHFDNEEIPKGNNRLQVKRQTIISNIQAGSYETARLEAGLALHTLQDFYSHSNWVELENTEPLEDLGRPTYTPSNIAGPSTPTCNSCERGQDVPLQLLVFTAAIAEFTYEYDCQDNIKSDILASNVLTTGYVGRAPNGNKPEGKCSHAGVGDFTATQEPVGGINKDSTTNVWSPRSDLHDQAANVAIKATVLFLRDIREAVGDELFGVFLNTRQLRASVAFVIDTTGSMASALPEIQAVLPRIQAGLESYQVSTGQIVGIEYILVNLNNSPAIETVIITNSSGALRDEVGRLTASGEGAHNCRGPSIEAIIQASLQCREGGVINVFTDGQPSDVERLPEVLSLIKTKSLKLNVFSINGCTESRRRKRQTGVDLYEHLAFISGGHILNVPAEDIANTDTVVSSSFRPSTDMLYRQAGSNISTVLQFQVDSTIQEVFITITGNGLQVSQLLNPQAINVLNESIVRVHVNTPSTFLATLNTQNAAHHGMWGLGLETTLNYRVLITGDSRLSYTYTLYSLTNELKEKPQPGDVILPVVTVDKDAERASITAASLVGISGEPLLPLSVVPDEETGNYLATAGAPLVPFALSVTGMDSRDIPFTRIVGSGVDVSDVTIGLSTTQSPFLALRSGENQTLILSLSNQGETSTFRVQVVSSGTSSGFTYYFEGMITSQSVSLENEGVTSLRLHIRAPENLAETNFLPLTVIVYDQSSITRNNYFNIQVTGTSVPPVDLSQIEFYNAGKKLGGGTLSYMILFSSFLVGAHLYRS